VSIEYRIGWDRVCIEWIEDPYNSTQGEYSERTQSVRRLEIECN
jgi:hypothetical protein